MDILTRTEEMILLAVYRLGEEAYGVTIREQVAHVAGRDFSVGAIYVPLDRLESRGYLTSYMGDPTPERGGRSKRFFRLTSKGIDALNATRTLHETMWAGISQLTRPQSNTA